MPPLRNIAVFTCNRADEGPMGPVVKAIKARPDLQYKDASRFIGGADLLLLLGDRHELLKACHIAVLAQIPIAHIHGGETTLGAFDDRVRNAVSQLATLHFTAAETFSDKLRSMKVPGEIFTVGAPGLDDLETDEASEFGENFFLVCLHPETAAGHDNLVTALHLCEALDRFADRRVLVIGPNADPGGTSIHMQMRAWAKLRGQVYVESLDRRRYLTALKHAAVCIGNSSSFIIEAPALGTPTVNVGYRQLGRPLAATVRTVAPTADAIEAAIQTALINRHHFEFVDKSVLPYGRGGASQKIAEVLAAWQPS